jgi:cytidine deaminase
MFKAISEGEKIRTFRRMAIAAEADTLTPPCGACRQLLWEFCGDMELTLVNTDGKSETCRVSELLPRAFDASFLS